MTLRDKVMQQYREMIRPPENGKLSEKPPVCTQDCGGRLPDPPASLPQARIQFQCGLGVFGCCPVRKSINRARNKARRRQLELWRRSVRLYRRRLQGQAVVLEHPRSYPGIEKAAARYPESALIDEETFAELRKELDITGALDVYLMLTRPPGRGKK